MLYDLMPLQVKEKYKALPTLKREHVIKIEKNTKTKTEFRTTRKTKLGSELETQQVNK